MHPYLMTALADTHQQDSARTQARRRLAAQVSRDRAASRVGLALAAGTRRLVDQLRPAPHQATCCA